MSELIYMDDGTILLPSNSDPATHGHVARGWLRYSVGLDLGGRGEDPSALVVLKSESKPYYTGRGWEQALTEPQYTVVFTETLHTPEATDVVDWLVKRLGQLKNWRLAVDGSGLGGPVVSMIEQAGIAVTSVTMTAGSSINRKGSRVTCSKNVLFENAASLFETGQLIIAHDLPEKQALMNEIQSVQLAMTSAGNLVLQGGGRGHHADRFVAMSLALLNETHLGTRQMIVSDLRGYY